MRLVDIGGGAVAFETEGTEDYVSNLNTSTLRQSGWSEQAIATFERFRTGSNLHRDSTIAAAEHEGWQQGLSSSRLG